MRRRLRPPSANQTRKPSDAELASRYLDLQRLRDEVRKAEARCPPRSSKRLPIRKAAAVDRSLDSLGCSVRPSDQQIVDFLSRP
jgi:hypothetical protein